jgi:NADH-ubiquinone oxidoreductase chain 1
VSGFNIEYGSGGFALLFLAEYGIIIYISYFVVYLYWGGLGFTLVLGLRGLFFCFVYLWVRGRLPRLRYDKLIILVWRGLLCVALGILVFYRIVGLYM